MRTPILAANWKMYKTIAQARAFVRELRQHLGGRPPVDVVICPPFTALASVAEEVAGRGIHLGAQNLHQEAEGAFTGEVSGAMLADLGVRYVIAGHSERRRHCGETDSLVREKVQAAFRHGLLPILCVGETLQEREAGQTDAVVDRQVQEALTGRTRDSVRHAVIAYEPVWAIGTGKNCDAAEADRVCGLIRQTLARLFDAPLAQEVRIQYGGSVKPENVAAYLAQPQIDGALVGGASLEAATFARIVQAGRT